MPADAPLHHLVIAQVVDPNGRPLGNIEVKAKRFADARYFMSGTKTLPFQLPFFCS